MKKRTLFVARAQKDDVDTLLENKVLPWLATNGAELVNTYVIDSEESRRINDLNGGLWTNKWAVNEGREIINKMNELDCSDVFIAETGNHQKSAHLLAEEIIKGGYSAYPKPSSN